MGNFTGYSQTLIPQYIVNDNGDTLATYSIEDFKVVVNYIDAGVTYKRKFHIIDSLFKIQNDIIKNRDNQLEVMDSLYYNMELQLQLCKEATKPRKRFKKFFINIKDKLVLVGIIVVETVIIGILISK